MTTSTALSSFARRKYGEKQEPRAARQLAKGAFHLAELLNKIQWQQTGPLCDTRFSTNNG